MGLDMYALQTDAPITQAGFKEPEHCTEVSYWRKHPNLHGWMEELYYRKGGSKEFNCESVRIDAADLDALEQVIASDALPPMSGFFFGHSRPDEKDVVGWLDVCPVGNVCK